MAEMTNEQQQLLIIRGSIASLPEEQQSEIKAVATDLRAILTNHKEIGMVALALVGAELAAQP